MIGRAALPLLALVAAADDPLAGRVAGPPVDCIELDRVQGPEVETGGIILYSQSRARIWRTRAAGACPGLDRFARLVVEVQGRRVCRDDRFRPIPPGSLPGAVCRFGGFVPYDLPKR